MSISYAEKRKSIIIDSAIVVFSKKGYHNTTMADIIKEASISRGGLYAHFNNIDNLYLESLKTFDKNNIIKYSEMNYTLKFEVFERMINDVNIKKPSMYRSISEFYLSNSQEDVPYLKERHEQLSQFIQNTLNEGIELNEFNYVNTSLTAELIISSLNGILINEYYQHSKDISLKKLLDEFLHILEKLLVKE